MRMEMWVTNSKMKELFASLQASPGEERLNIKFDQLNDLFFPQFKRVKDCMIISSKPVEQLEEAFDRAVKMYMDKTGYEASNTETRINCFFENHISMELGTRIGLMALEVWVLQLKRMEPQSKFCMILSSNQERVEIRFHKIHQGEGMLLDEELENYKDGAIGYVVV